MHALIIEDLPLIAEIIADILEALGFDSIATAAHEHEAVALALEKRPDLITADIRLASGNGISAVKEICKARPVPVVYVTGTAWEAAALDDAVVVPKPFSPPQLVNAVMRARASIRVSSC
jgi:two-component system, response regulator PdtaR